MTTNHFALDTKDAAERSAARRARVAAELAAKGKGYGPARVVSLDDVQTGDFLVAIEATARTRRTAVQSIVTVVHINGRRGLQVAAVDGRVACTYACNATPATVRRPL